MRTKNRTLDEEVRAAAELVAGSRGQLHNLRRMAALCPRITKYYCHTGTTRNISRGILINIKFVKNEVIDYSSKLNDYQKRQPIIINEEHGLQNYN